VEEAEDSMSERSEGELAREAGGEATISPPSEHGGEAPNGLYAEISREMVRLYKVQFGRGPTKVKTQFAGPDCLICTLENSFTPAEKSLVEMGEHQRLRDTRLFFQYATEEEFRDLIERLVKRRVRAFVSGIDTTKDVSAEVFYLEPASDDDLP
jgi:uncharacterized protein YbcI